MNKETYYKAKADAVDGFLDKLEQIEDERICTRRSIGQPEEEPQKMENPNKWENLMKVATISDETRQLLIAQGKINDAYSIVATTIQEYWGNMKMIGDFYTKINDASIILNEIMGNMMYDKMNDLDAPEI